MPATPQNVRRELRKNPGVLRLDAALPLRGLTRSLMETGAPVMANVKTGERGAPAAELYAEAERLASELQGTQPVYVVLTGITKMQWRQGVLDVSCDAVAPIEKP